MRWLLFTLAWIGTAAAGGVYKWTDADGNVHFGDRPPDARAERVQTPDSEPSSTPQTGLRPGERALLKRAAQAQRKRLRARQAAIRARSRDERERAQWKESCVRQNIDLQAYKDERAQGCRQSRCRYLDRMIARAESMLREHCE